MRIFWRFALPLLRINGDDAAKSGIAVAMKHIKILIASFIVAIFGTTVLAQSEYRVRAGDVLEIEVLEDTSLNRSVVVLDDGRISFPFAGTVVVGGRTVGQIEVAITSAIADNFAAAPNVFVAIRPKERAAAAPREPEPDPTIEVYFLGEVNTPGLREVAPGTTFLQAFAQSGGLTRFAADKRVQLRRTDPRSGQQTTISINYRAILDGAAMRDNVRLQNGDVIIVPERRLFE